MLLFYFVKLILIMVTIQKNIYVRSGDPLQERSSSRLLFKSECNSIWIPILIKDIYKFSALRKKRYVPSMPLCLSLSSSLYNFYMKNSKLKMNIKEINSERAQFWVQRYNVQYNI